MKKFYGVFILLIILSGCKSKQITQEHIVTSVDSTAITSLKNQLSERTEEVAGLRIDLSKAMDEVSKLQSEVSSHTINYDTSAPVNPETGKYPIASETITQTRQQLDRTIKELNAAKSEYQKDITAERSKNTSLQHDVNILRDENSELKSKTTPTTGSNFKIMFWSFITGIVITTIFFLRNKIRSFLRF